MTGTRWVVRLAWFPALGPGLLSVLFGLAVLADLPAPEWVALASLALIWAVIAKRGGLGPEVIPTTDTSRASTVATAVMAVAVASAIGLFVRDSILRPEGEWDAMGIWNYHARLLAALGHDAQEVIGADTSGGPDYPFGHGAAVAAIWRLTSSTAPFVSQAVAFVYLVGLLATTWCVVATHGSRTAAAFATAAVAATPAVSVLSAHQYADVPVAWGVLAAAWGLSARAPLAGLALGLLCWSKNDGAVLALLVVAVHGWSGLRALRRPALVCGLLAPLVAFVWHKMSWAPASDLVVGSGGITDRLLSGDRWGPVLAGFLGELHPITIPRRFGVTWMLVGACAVFAFNTRRARGVPMPGVRALGLIGAAGVGLWVVTVVAVHRPATWQWDTAGWRLMTQVLPVCVAWAACRCDGGHPRDGITST